MPRPTIDDYVSTARARYAEAGRIDIDLKPEVLIATARPLGAYVQAWVWVTDEGAVAHTLEAEAERAHRRHHALTLGAQNGVS